MRKTAAQLRQNLRRRREHEMQAAAARGELLGNQRLPWIVPHLIDPEITQVRCVQDGVD